jgi:hypothetical protein
VYSCFFLTFWNICNHLLQGAQLKREEIQIKLGLGDVSGQLKNLSL